MADTTPFAIAANNTGANGTLHDSLSSGDERFRRLVENSNDGVVLLDRQATVLYANPAYEKVTGFTAAQMIGQNALMFVQADDLPHVKAMLEQVIQQPEQVIKIDFRLVRRDGAVRLVETNLSMLPNGEIVAHGRDVTESRQAEQELIDLNAELERRVAERTAALEASLLEQRRLAAIIEATSDYVGIADLEGWSLYVNEAGRSMIEKTAEDYASEWHVSRCHPASELPTLGGMIQTCLAGETWMGETKLLTVHSQREIPVSCVAVPLKDADGKVESIAAIMRDISERKHFETELQRAKEAAEAANRAKGAFLANMSHEIRTPMNAIIGMTSLLLDMPLDDKQHEFVEIIRNSGDSLLTIINDILDFSKIEAEKLEIVQRPFDLRDCIESALDLLASRAGEKNLDLVYMMERDTPITIVSDVTRLRQILVNLLSNAVKFTDEGEVVLSVSSAPNPDGQTHSIRFAVRDTGMGIPQNKMDRLFKSFSQIDASTTREYGGTGLGLAISKRLSEMMGGTMWVESDGVPGHGATFSFTINAEGIYTPLRSHLHTPQPHLRGKSVLIVDDNPTNRRILSLQVQTWGMIPREAALPSEAIRILQGAQFDAAILDMHMPEMDGQMLAKEIRRREVETNMPMIMYTSLSQHNSVGDEFFAFLTKPVKPSELYNVLVRLFDEQGALATQTAAPVVNEDVPLAQRIPLHILLAEDVVVNQKFAVQALARMGYRVDVVANGMEVLDAVQRQAYQVILMDVQMPEMDGLEATRQIRHLQAIRQPHIIAMTANAMQGDREVCIEAGMDDYISKPVYIHELKAALERAGKALSGSGSSLTAIDTQPLKPIANGTPAYVETPAPLELDVELVAAFLEEAPMLLANLRGHVERADAKGVKAVAHQLKGSAAYVGAETLRGLCGDLEKRAAAGDLSTAPDAFQQIDAELGRVMESLRG